MIKSMRGGIPQLMKKGTTTQEGSSQQFKSIEAVKQLSQITKTSLGPHGMNKMIINHLDKLFVTSDCATIMHEMEVVHASAKMVVLASQMQEKEIGDGSNFVVVFCGELLSQAEELLRMGLHCSDIVNGYAISLKKTLEFLDDICCYTETNLYSVDSLKKGVYSALSAKQYGYEDLLSNIVAQACTIAMPAIPSNFLVDNVRVIRILGGSVSDSSVIKGMVLTRNSETSITDVTNPKIAVFSCAIDIAQTETKGTVLINNAKDLMDYNLGEQEMLEKTIKGIADSGVSVVFTGGSIGEMALHFLNKYKLMAVKVLSKFDLRRLCVLTNSKALVELTVPIKEELGFAYRVHGQEIGSTNITIIEQEVSMGTISTVILRGSTHNILNDLERAIDDGVNVVRMMTRDGRFVPGAGSTEIELSRRLRIFADTCKGLEQYSIKKFAESLEIIPRSISDNAGLPSNDLLSQLLAAHTDGKITYGLNIEEQSVSDAVSRNILDLLVTKHQALKLAVNTAITLLRVDKIIMSKPAGGPSLPQQQGHWDDQED